MGGDLMRSLIIKYHDKLWAGHQEEERTSALLLRAYYWLQMRDDIATYVKTCLVCQQDKTDYEKKTGLLEALFVSTRSFKSVSMDYIVSLPKVGDLGTIIIVVDHLSKYVIFNASPRFALMPKRSLPTNKSPFETVTGQQPLLSHTLDIDQSTKSPQAKIFYREWERSIEIAQNYLEKA
ncbi:Uncharacterized protein Adt_03116 [Abeliophyllum distichum]|uniref:Integrase zinc-binding domain-containing protein n=1 Tax=Abeliophyllum distichum TaxID=126358 RepID=A0ABD1VZR1_9LAMI